MPPSSLPCCKNQELLAKDFIIRLIRRRDIGLRASTTGPDSRSTVGQHWSPLQKAVPIIVGVATFLVLVCLFLLRGKIVPCIRACFTRLPHVKRSRRVSRDSSIGIESKGEAIDIDYANPTGEYAFVNGVDPDPPTTPRTSSPVEISHWSDYSSSRHGRHGPEHRETRITLSSLIIPGRPSATDTSDSWHVPGIDTLRNIRFPELPNLWGGPTTVQHVPYTRRFRLNSLDHSTDTSTPVSIPSNRFSSSSKHQTSTENGLGSRTHETILEDEELDFDSEHGGISRSDDERHNLLPNNDSVFLISRGGRNFTLESGSSNSAHVRPNVASMSASSRSEESDIPARVATPPHIEIPPPPRGPAPSPPSRSRSPGIGPKSQLWEASKSHSMSGRPPQRSADFSPYSPPPDLAKFEVTRPSPLRTQFRISAERHVPLRPIGASPPYGLQEVPPYPGNEGPHSTHQRHFSADSMLGPWDGNAGARSESPTHTRRASEDSVTSVISPNRGAAVMLFPAVVRGAGYRVGNRSSDSLHSNSSSSPRYPPGMG